MKISCSFFAFKKELNQKGLESGDKAYWLKFHELKIDKENSHKLMDLPTDKLLKLTVELNE